MTEKQIRIAKPQEALPGHKSLIIPEIYVVEEGMVGIRAVEIIPLRARFLGRADAVSVNFIPKSPVPDVVDARLFQIIVGSDEHQMRHTPPFPLLAQVQGTPGNAENVINHASIVTEGEIHSESVDEGLIIVTDMGALYAPPGSMILNTNMGIGRDEITNGHGTTRPDKNAGYTNLDLSFVPCVGREDAEEIVNDPDYSERPNIIAIPLDVDIREIFTRKSGGPFLCGTEADAAHYFSQDPAIPLPVRYLS